MLARSVEIIKPTADSEARVRRAGLRMKRGDELGSSRMVRWQYLSYLPFIMLIDWLSDATCRTDADNQVTSV